MKDSDLILFMINNNEPLTEDLKELMKQLKDKNYLLLINKIDLKSKLNKQELDVDQNKIVELSIKENKGIAELKEKIIELFNMNEIEEKDPTYLSNIRTINILKNCLKIVGEVKDSITKELPIDMIELDIKRIWEELGKINGSTYEEELLDEMFKRFCLGK